MRILIATITAGAGHLAAAAALKEAWTALRPEDVVDKVDLLDFTGKLYRKFFAEGYVKLVEAAPELYGMVFKKTDNHERVAEMTEFRRKFAYRTSKGFVRHLKEFNPDAVLCVHPLPLDVLGHLRSFFLFQSLKTLPSNSNCHNSRTTPSDPLKTEKIFYECDQFKSIQSKGQGDDPAG